MNSPVANTSVLSARRELEEAKFMNRVYLWMTGGVLTTAAAAFYVLGNDFLMSWTMEHFLGLILAQLGIVIALDFAKSRISPETATIGFFSYAVLTGVTGAVLFRIYTGNSISEIFLLTAICFAGLSAIGYLTQKDLGLVGAFCTMLLFGLLGYAVLALIWPGMRGYAMNPLYSIIGVIVFAGLTAADTQRIKQMRDRSSDELGREAIYGALTLYLDFINLFLHLLRLMGRRRRLIYEICRAELVHKMEP